MLLNEPTNHMDMQVCVCVHVCACVCVCVCMQSIDALCDAVEEFQGGVVVISHDAQLLSRLCADEERSQVRVTHTHTHTPVTTHSSCHDCALTRNARRHATHTHTQPRQIFPITSTDCVDRDAASYGSLRTAQ